MYLEQCTVLSKVQKEEKGTTPYELYPSMKWSAAALDLDHHSPSIAPFFP